MRNSAKKPPEEPRVAWENLFEKCEPYQARSADARAALMVEVDFDGPFYTLEEVEKRRANRSG